MLKSREDGIPVDITVRQSHVFPEGNFGLPQPTKEKPCQDSAFACPLPVPDVTIDKVSHFLSLFINELHAATQSLEKIKGGTTLTTAVVVGDQVAFCWRGDSEGGAYADGKVIDYTNPHVLGSDPACWPQQIAITYYPPDIAKEIRGIVGAVVKGIGIGGKTQLTEAGSGRLLITFSLDVSQEQRIAFCQNFKVACVHPNVSVRTAAGSEFTRSVGDWSDRSSVRTSELKIVSLARSFAEGKAVDLILASDGVWAMMGDGLQQRHAQLATFLASPEGSLLVGGDLAVSGNLVGLSFNRWRTFGYPDSDDISVVHARLRADAPCPPMLLGVADGHGKEIGHVCAEFCKIAFKCIFPGALDYFMHPEHFERGVLAQRAREGLMASPHAALVSPLIEALIQKLEYIPDLISRLGSYSLKLNDGRYYKERRAAKQKGIGLLIDVLKATDAAMMRNGLNALSADPEFSKMCAGSASKRFMEFFGEVREWVMKQGGASEAAPYGVVGGFGGAASKPHSDSDDDLSITAHSGALEP